MGPPSFGRIAVLQMLGILERTPFAPRRDRSRLQRRTCSPQRDAFAFAGPRAFISGDRNFQRKDPSRPLLNPSYLQREQTLLEKNPSEATPGDTEAAGTSPLSIVEANGDGWTLTPPSRPPSASRIMVRGFHLNNELTDFDFTPGTPNESGRASVALEHGADDGVRVPTAPCAWCSARPAAR